VIGGDRERSVSLENPLWSGTNLSTSLAEQAVSIKEVDQGIWLVSFMDYDLGYIVFGVEPEPRSGQGFLVDGMGFEPTTPALRTPCSPS
jgi:hypothetical protein